MQVKKVITYKITYTTGGSSVHLHVLSAESRKYFRSAIPMSGTAYNYWSLSDENHLEHAHNIAKELGEPKKSDDELVEFFKKVPADKIRNYGKLNLLSQSLLAIPIAPIVESTYFVLNKCITGCY